eukprot:1015007-Prymnesium_polylepis.1
MWHVHVACGYGDGVPAIFFVYVSANEVASACLRPCWKRGFGATSGLEYQPTAWRDGGHVCDEATHGIRECTPN